MTAVVACASFVKFCKPPLGLPLNGKPVRIRRNMKQFMLLLVPLCGPKGIRTPRLYYAIVALYQMSYGPLICFQVNKSAKLALFYRRSRVCAIRPDSSLSPFWRCRRAGKGHLRYRFCRQRCYIDYLVSNRVVQVSFFGDFID